MEDKDFVKVAKSYARSALGDKDNKRHGKWIKLAAARFLTDLKRAKLKKNNFYFDEEEANRACEFIEMMPHIEGEWDSDTIILDPFQVFFIVQLFGFRLKGVGTRRYTMALFAIGRKNGKSALASAIGIYIFVCENQNGPQVITAATTGQQARIVFSVAKAMIDRCSDLREEFEIETFAHSIACYANHGSFKPVSAKASTQDGLNPSCVILDEIHAHKTPDLVNVLKSAAGARRNPLWLYLTTEGYENPGPWPDLRKFAQQVLEEVLEAEHFLCLIFALDENDEEYDEKAWVKANPLVLSNDLLLKAIKKEAIEAQSMPSVASEFKIKRCNRPASVAGGFVDLSHFKKCGRILTLDDLEGYPCYGAFDLASTRDTTAWRLIWEVEDKIYTWGRFWVPKDCVFQRTIQGTATYDGWINAGWMTQTEGNVTDYNVVFRDIMEDCERFNPEMVAYDDWNAQDIVNRLSDEDVPLINFVQGPRSYHPAIKRFERIYLKGDLIYEDSPVLTWHASNLVMRYDENLNMAPDKKRSAEKIDGMVTLLMAIGISENTEGDSVYEQRGVLSI